MNGCVYRTEENKCKQFSVGGVLSFCYLDGACDCQIPSNADHIRSMSDEELADFIAGQRGWYCDFKDPSEEEYSKVLDWLKATVEEGDNG